jgi:hypothetical protein
MAVGSIDNEALAESDRLDEAAQFDGSSFSYAMATAVKQEKAAYLNSDSAPE